MIPLNDKEMEARFEIQGSQAMDPLPAFIRITMTAAQAIEICNTLESIAISDPVSSSERQNVNILRVAILQVLSQIKDPYWPHAVTPQMQSILERIRLRFSPGPKTEVVK